jgi:predicted permease
VAGDLLEEFAEISARHGSRAARRWFRRQVARSIAARVLARMGHATAAIAALPTAAWRVARIRADVGPASRALRRAPWYSATVVAVVALTLALAATVFAVVDGVLFKPLPYPDDEQITQVRALTPSMIGAAGVYAGNASIPDLRAWREALPEVAFTATTFGSSWPFSDNETYRVATVDRDFFQVMGVQPLLGGFDDDDFGPLTEIRPALVTYRLWQDRLGGDPAVIGRVFAASDGEGMRVAGVLRPDFLFPHSAVSAWPPEALLPLPAPSAERQRDPRLRFLHVIARVPDSLPLAVADERLTAAAARVADLFPPMSAEDRASFRAPFVEISLWVIRDAMTRRTSTVSGASMAAAVFLVLLAGLNLAGLAGSRVLDRRHELSLRRALGARTADVIRVVVVEQAMLLGAGMAAGLALSWWMLRAAPWMLPGDITMLKAPAIDARVVAFAALACAATLVLATLWAARVGLRVDLRPALAGAGGASERVRSLPRLIIVGGQVALALVMIVAGALFTGSLARLWSEDTGFDVDRVAVLQVQTPNTVDMAYINDVLDVVRRQPGVTAAGGLGGPFLQRAIAGSSFLEPADALETGDVEHLRVTAGTLEAMGLVPIEGRLPTGDEHAGGRRVIVVSGTVAHAYFPGRPAVGRTLIDEDGRAFEIVGVVSDARYRSLDLEPDGEIYSLVSARERPNVSNVLVSYSGDAARGLGGTVAALGVHAPSLRVRSAMTVRQKLGVTVQSRQFQTATFAGFGVAALAIAAAGILGLVAMTVARRAREVGIRMSLGATPGAVVGMMMREHLAAVAGGLAVGTVGAAWSVRAIASYLYQTSAYDWSAWTVAIIVLLSVTSIAVLLPSLRASRVDPVRALRAE